VVLPFILSFFSTLLPLIPHSQSNQGDHFSTQKGSSASSCPQSALVDHPSLSGVRREVFLVTKTTFVPSVWETDQAVLETGVQSSRVETDSRVRAKAGCLETAKATVGDEAVCPFENTWSEA